jgi:hypothetical protein
MAVPSTDSATDKRMFTARHPFIRFSDSEHNAAKKTVIVKESSVQVHSAKSLAIRANSLTTFHRIASDFAKNR